MEQNENFDFDISSLSYDEFIEYFLTSPESELWDVDPKGNRFILPKITQPEKILKYLTRFCTEFREMANRVSLQSINHGINGMLSSAAFQLQSVLWDDTLDLQARILCIRSMYRVFADFVAGRKVKVLEGCFYMWWDDVCSNFWFEQTYHRKLPAKDYGLLSEKDRKLVDAMFGTLIEILKLDDGGTKSSALHGLGHLHHPGVRTVVQEFIDTHSSELDPDEISWFEKCRDGTVM